MGESSAVTMDFFLSLSSLYQMHGDIFVYWRNVDSSIAYCNWGLSYLDSLSFDGTLMSFLGSKARDVKKTKVRLTPIASRNFVPHLHEPRLHTVVFPHFSNK